MASTVRVSPDFELAKDKVKDVASFASLPGEKMLGESKPSEKTLPVDEGYGSMPQPGQPLDISSQGKDIVIAKEAARPTIPIIVVDRIASIDSDRIASIDGDIPLSPISPILEEHLRHKSVSHSQLNLDPAMGALRKWDNVDSSGSSLVPSDSPNDPKHDYRQMLKVKGKNMVSAIKNTWNSKMVPILKKWSGSNSGSSSRPGSPLESPIPTLNTRLIGRAFSSPTQLLSKRPVSAEGTLEPPEPGVRTGDSEWSDVEAVKDTGTPTSAYLAVEDSQAAEDGSSFEETASDGEQADEFDSDGSDAYAAVKRRFRAEYQVLQQLGSGGHSIVRLATHRRTGRTVVCKFIRHSSVWHWHCDPDTPKHKIPLEIYLMQRLNENGFDKIINYIEHFELNKKYIIVMEYMGEDWVDLYDYVEMFGPVNEEHTKYIFKQVVETIQHLHLIGYCHNDIKDENIIINTKTRAIKLIDFGSATPMEPGQTFTLFYGTKKFAAPEAISGEYYYPEAQEVWALGTLLYVLLFKMDPFKTDQEIVDLDIARRVHKLRYPRHGVGHDISDDAVEAILAMLEKDYQQRLSASEILKLSFFDSVRDD